MAVSSTPTDGRHDGASQSSWQSDQKSSHRYPDVIAHRGFKGRYPENTMAAFKGAVKIGAHAIETDVHLTRDDVVVMSHDGDLGRCFGVHKKIIDCDWEYVSTLRTLAEPPQKLPSLKELLSYLAEDAPDMRLMLDIKRDNNAENIIRRIADAIAEVPLKSGRQWSDRIRLGIWTDNYLPIVEAHLPGYPVTHIGISTSYARKFLGACDIILTINLIVLQGPGGRKFIREMRENRNTPVWAWTVNSPSQMEWCIDQGLDGVITDHPDRLIQTYRDFDESGPRKGLSFQRQMFAFYVWLMASMFGPWLRDRHGGGGPGGMPIGLPDGCASS